MRKALIILLSTVTLGGCGMSDKRIMEEVAFCQARSQDAFFRKVKGFYWIDSIRCVEPRQPPSDA